MPRYFLTIEHFDDPPTIDEDGFDFHDLDAALCEAKISVTELLLEAIRNSGLHTPSRIIVRDEAGLEVGAVAARDVVHAGICS